MGKRALPFVVHTKLRETTVVTDAHLAGRRKVIFLQYQHSNSSRSRQVGSVQQMELDYPASELPVALST